MLCIWSHWVASRILVGITVSWDCRLVADEFLRWTQFSRHHNGVMGAVIGKEVPFSC